MGLGLGFISFDLSLSIKPSQTTPILIRLDGGFGLYTTFYSQAKLLYGLGEREGFNSSIGFGYLWYMGDSKFSPVRDAFILTEEMNWNWHVKQFSFGLTLGLTQHWHYKVRDKLYRRKKDNLSVLGYKGGFNLLYHF